MRRSIVALFVGTLLTAGLATGANALPMVRVNSAADADTGIVQVYSRRGYRANRNKGVVVVLGSRKRYDYRNNWRGRNYAYRNNWRGRTYGYRSNWRGNNSGLRIRIN